MKARPGLFKLAAIAAAVLGLAFIAQPAQAQTPVTYTQGDLLLGFKKAGVATDVVINIGQASLYRDATSDFSVSVGNLGTLLSDNFGATWYDDSSLQWAVFGNPSNDGTTFNGDASNTTYITKEQTTVDTQSTAFNILAPVRATAASRMQNLQNQFMLQDADAGNAFATVWDNTLVSGAAVDWTDAFVGTGTSFLAFQAFTPAQVQGQDPTGIDYPGNALDLWRLLGGSTGTSGVTYEGTFRIDDTGAVTFSVTPGVVPEPSRALLLAFGLALPLLRRRRASVTAVPALA